MTTFAVIGGTGTVGRHIVKALGEAHPTATDVRVLSRSSAEHPVDLATVARAPQPGRTMTVGGPQHAPVSELAPAWAQAHRRRGLRVVLPPVGRMRRPLLGGALTCPHPDSTGTVTFATWLTAQH